MYALVGDVFVDQYREVPADLRKLGDCLKGGKRRAVQPRNKELEEIRIAVHVQIPAQARVQHADHADDLAVALDPGRLPRVQCRVLGGNETNLLLLSGRRQQRRHVGLGVEEIGGSRRLSPLLRIHGADDGAGEHQVLLQPALALLEAQAALENAHSLPLTGLVLAHDLDETRPKARAHHRHIC